MARLSCRAGNGGRRRARIKEATVFGLPPVPVFCAVLALGLILRFILGYNINGFEADISCFKAWAAYTHDYGFNNMYYRDFFLDYPPGYLYVLYIIEAFRRLFGIDQYAQSYTLMIKLAPILSDIACAAALWVLARKKLGEKSALLIAFAPPSLSIPPSGVRPIASARFCSSAHCCFSGTTTRRSPRSSTASAS